MVTTGKFVVPDDEEMKEGFRLVKPSFDWRMVGNTFVKTAPAFQYVCITPLARIYMIVPMTKGLLWQFSGNFIFIFVEYDKTKSEEVNSEIILQL